MNELESIVRPRLEALLKTLFGIAAEDYQLFGKEMAEDLAAFLYRVHAKGESEVEKDIRHLKAQGKLLAAKHRVHLTAESIKSFVAMLEELAKFGLALLKISLPAV